MVSSASAVEPVIRTLNLRGLQIGATTTLVIDGDDLGTAPRLLLPFPAQQTLKPGGTDKKATFDVALAADVTPGYHHLRVVAEGGVSLPVVIGVDRLPQRPLAAVDQLPVALHGAVSGSAVVETTFTGKAGQKVTVEVEAQRLGSKLRPIVHLYNAKRLQLAWAWTTPALDGDTRLEAALPADGTYTVTLHDAEYAAAAPSFFRLKIGQWAFVDQVFPPVIGKGQAQTLELLGSSSAPSIKEPAAANIGALPLSWPKDGLWSGPRPFVKVSARAEVVEQAAASGLQELPAGAVGVSGRLLKPNEEDRYRLAVTPGTKLRLEVFAERIGSPLDAALVIRNEKGDALLRGEDSPSTLDPVLDYTVPDKVTALVVGVADSQGRGGPRGVYHLTIDPQGATAAKGDFQLTTPVQRLTLPVGGQTVLPIRVERRGYAGSIDLSAATLPGGVRLEGATIPAGADGALVTVASSAATAEPVVTAFRGRTPDGDERTVTVQGHPLERLQPWLATEIAVGTTTAKSGDFLVDWRDLPTDAALVPTGKRTLPVKVTRAVANTAVRFTLLTGQPPVLLANNQPDPNRTLRLEKPVELGANTPNADLTVLVPALLTAPVCDVTVQAELLTPDKRTVLAVAFAPVRRMTVVPPLVVRLTGPDRVPVKLDSKTGATVKIQGKVERREGLTGDVAVSLLGAPGTAPNESVKGTATDFVLNVVIPANQPPGEIKGLKLTATAVADPRQPNVRVQSPDVFLTLVIEPPAK